MDAEKTIGLVAHDACKKDMVEWVTYNVEKLRHHRFYCTGTTGRLVQEVFDTRCPGCGVSITRFQSGPLGGDQQMGALIASGGLDILVFFADPMTMQPHDVDVKALIRISGIANTVVALTRSTADFVISSPLFDTEYRETRPDYQGYIQRATIEPVSKEIHLP